MIVKIQVPLSSSLKNPPALVYNEDRTVDFHIEVSVVADIMLERPKAYFHAVLKKDGGLVIGKEAGDQPW